MENTYLKVLLIFVCLFSLVSFLLLLTITFCLFVFCRSWGLIPSFCPAELCTSVSWLGFACARLVMWSPPGCVPLRHERRTGPPPQLSVLWRRGTQTEHHAGCGQFWQRQDPNKTQRPQPVCQQDRPMQRPLLKHGREVPKVYVGHFYHLCGYPLAIHVPAVQPGVRCVLADVWDGLLGHRPPSWWHGK